MDRDRALVERDHALSALAASAHRAANGAGRLVLISGEAGVGKSAVVERFLEGRRGAHIYRAACDGLFTPAPLAPLYDLARLVGGDLARMLALDPRPPRHSLFAALLEALVHAPTPSILVLEDIHWADEATLDLLQYLVARIRTSKVLVIATYRTDAVRQSFPLRVALGELVTRPDSSRIELEPLSREAVSALAAGTSVDVDDLFRQTSGNPFFVTEALGTGFRRVPSSVRDAVLARAARLDESSRDLLDVAALIGTSVEPGLLLAAGAARPTAIDDLVAAHLLGAAGPQLAFRHEIARRAVADGIGPYRSVAIHGRILAALVQTGCQDHARLAFHAEEAGATATALSEATLAARQAVALSSHREAAAQLERALRVVGDEPPDALAGRYVELAVQLQQIDRIPDADVAYAHALELAREAGNVLTEGHALRGLAQTRWLLGRGGESAVLADQALQVLRSHVTHTQSLAAQVRRAGDLMAAGRLDEAILLARRARADAEGAGARDVVSFALNREAAALWYAGRDWLPSMQESLRVALESNTDSEAAYAFTNLHEFSCRSMDFAAADRYYEEGRAYCAAHEVGVYECFIAGDHAVALERRGRWSKAVDVASGVLDVVVASPINRMIPMLSLGRIAARRGEPGALASIERGAEIAAGSQVPDYVVFAELARAEALWLEGRTGEALIAAERADDACAHLIDVERGEVATWLLRLGSARRARGPIRGPYAPPVSGDHDRVAAQWLAVGCPYLAALAWYDSGTEVGLRRALDICTDLGAVATATLVRRRMRTLGVRGVATGRRAATRANPLGLTNREHDVLSLLAQGRTNQEIAQQLVLSTRTVDHHVSAVLGKLGVARRGQAIAAAVRLLAPVPAS